MTPDEGSHLNRQSYDAVASQWDAVRTSLGPMERPYFDAFLAALPPCGRIVDLGCGTGRPIAELLLAAGHRVTGVDQSAAQIALARSRFPAGTWVRASIEDFTPLEPLDGVVCWDALFHVHRTHHAAILGRIARAMRPEGVVMLTIGGSAHPAFTDTMLGANFFYDSYPPDETLRMLGALGLAPILADFLNRPTTGRDKGRYGVLARKR